METTLQNPSKSRSLIWPTGLAIFAMFFGAGNIVFPISLGQVAQSQTPFGLLGLLFTAILVPLSGLIAMLLFEGDYNAFFRRIGKIPGFCLVLMILGLIGPFGGIPRCITISYSTLCAFGIDGAAGVNVVSFSLLSCLLIFAFTFRPSRILTLLGYVLTPVLLLSLGVIALKGLFSMPHAPYSGMNEIQAFSRGFLDGYNTMDLLAAFFFSSVVLLCLKGEKGQAMQDNRQLLKVAIYGSLIAATLLSVIYISYAMLSAGFSEQLASVPSGQMLGTLAYQILGPYAGLVTGVVVSFACLTTEIALTAVIARFLHQTLSRGKLSYPLSILLTLVASFLVSTLQFEGICAFIVPILQVCYPALIALTFVNILHKTTGFKTVKPIVYGVLLITLIFSLS